MSFATLGTHSGSLILQMAIYLLHSLTAAKQRLAPLITSNANTGEALKAPQHVYQLQDRSPPLLLFPKTLTSYIYKSEKLAIQLHSDVHSEICSGVCSGIHLYPLLFSYPSLSIHFPHPADSTPCHFPQSSPAQHHFGHLSHVHVMSATQIQTTHNKNTILKTSEYNSHI